MNRKCCVLPDHSLATHIRPLELLIPYTYLVNLYIFQISAIPYFRVFPACSVPHISAACNKVNTITYTISSTLLCIHIQLPTFPQILPISYTLSLSHTHTYINMLDTKHYVLPPSFLVRAITFLLFTLTWNVCVLHTLPFSYTSCCNFSSQATVCAVLVHLSYLPGTSYICHLS